MTKAINDIRGYQALISHTRPSYRKVAEVLCKKPEVTAREIVIETKISLSSIQSVLADFKKMGFVHVCRWERPESSPRSLFAVYKKGKGVDVPKPMPRYLEQYINKKEKDRQRKEAQAEQTETWKELAKRLTPKRSPTQQKEVNRMYLNWISEGAYG